MAARRAGALLWALLLAGAPGGVRAKAVTISNTAARRNTSGQIIDAHDGSYSQWTPGGPWYYYAMGYGTCKQGGPHCHGCGYGYSWIGVWRSADMSNNSWTLVREARDDSWPSGEGVGAYFRVHVVYNALTKLYVMWVNLSGGRPADYVVGTSTSAEGPFTFRAEVNARYSSSHHAGDFDILRLRDDFVGSVYSTPPPGAAPSALPPQPPAAGGNSSGYFGNEFVEAPAIFEKDGTYPCCCFCEGGSGIGVYTAARPLGPWTYHDNIGCSAADPPAAGCGCGMKDKMAKNCTDLSGTAVTKAQQNYVVKVPGEGGKLQYIWTGDMWQSAPDGIKAHDFQFWAPLAFNAKTGLPEQVKWIDSFQLDVSTAEAP
eukprot:gene5789-4941_t